MTTIRFDFQGHAPGTTLSGRLEKPNGTIRAYALFAHCFSCTKDSLAAVRIARSLARKGIAVLRFDFTGLGESEGAFGTDGFSGDIADILSAARAMDAAGMGPQLLIGHSLGGAAVLAAAQDLPSVRAVATLGAPSELSHVTTQFPDRVDDIVAQGAAEVMLGGRAFTLRKSFLDDLAGPHDLRDRIAHLGRALLVLHAARDETVGIEHAGAIFGAARHPKSFVSLDGADHLLTDKADAEYAAEVIAAWAGRYLTPPIGNPADAAMPTGVTVERTGTGKFQVSVAAAGTRFYADEPVSVGGLATGPGPFDLVAAGLGACTVMTMQLYADHKGFPLPALRVEVDHARETGETPADLFSRRIVFTQAVEPERRAKLLDIADRCPVHRMLTTGARVRTVGPDTDVAIDPPQAHVAAMDASDQEEDAV